MSYLGNSPANVPLRTTDIPDGLITNAKLAPDAVTTDKILDGTIVKADMSLSAQTSKLNTFYYSNS